MTYASALPPPATVNQAGAPPSQEAYDLRRKPNKQLHYRVMNGVFGEGRSAVGVQGRHPLQGAGGRAEAGAKSQVQGSWSGAPYLSRSRVPSVSARAESPPCRLEVDFSSGRGSWLLRGTALLCLPPSSVPQCAGTEAKLDRKTAWPRCGAGTPLTGWSGKKDSLQAATPSQAVLCPLC